MPAKNPGARALDSHVARTRATLGCVTPEVLHYIYHLYTPDGMDFLAYHWHPEVARREDPHLHVYVATPKVDLRRKHLPTGYISPTTFVRLLIEEFGVEPLRPDWQIILQ